MRVLGQLPRSALETLLRLSRGIRRVAIFDISIRKGMDLSIRDYTRGV